MSGSRRSTPWTEWVQAKQSVYAVRISVLSLLATILMGGWSLVQQAHMNDETRADKLTQYAARVSWWPTGGLVNLGWRSPALIPADTSLGPTDIVIQNGSPVPINDVHLRYRHLAGPLDEEAALGEIHEGPPYITVVVIPPCTTSTIKLEELGRFLLNWSAGPTGSPIGQPGLARVDFTDAHGTWGVAFGRSPIALEPRDQDALASSGPWLSGDLVKEQPEDNCGVD
jgi:hypothetical protein